MKINIEFDMTPAEFRKILGLPDVELMNENLLLQMQKMMKEGVDGIDPLSILTPMVSQSIENFSSVQNLMLQALTSYSSTTKDKKNETKTQAQEKKQPEKPNQNQNQNQKTQA